MKTTEFKIFGTGKGASKTYATKIDAEQAIKVNKILPYIGNEYVIIEETIKKEHNIKVDVPTLSIKNRKFLIDYVLKNLNETNMKSACGICNPVWLLRYPERHHPTFMKLMREWIEANYTITQEELDDMQNKSKYRFCCDSPLGKKLDDRAAYTKAYVECIKKVFDTAAINDIKFYCNVTDYKPCHNILIELEFVGHCGTMDSFNLQIRKNDFPWNEGTCYGRNTNAISSTYLIDDNFDKWCKDLSIK